MTTVNGNMSAEQFFWSKIDKDGSGTISTIFEISDAESKGFSAKIGMTREEFIEKNAKAIQKRANTDTEYSSYQLEQAQRKKEENIDKKISKMKEFIGSFKGEKPSMGLEKATESSVKTDAEAEKNEKTGKRGQSLYKVELPTAEDLTNVKDKDKEKAKAEYVKIFINHKKYPEKGGRVAILPDKLEEYTKKAEEEFEAKWQTSRELLEQSK